MVEGSALRAGERVRITVQLVDAVADRSLWARSYDRDLGDILTLQSEVAGAIAEEIRVKVTPAEQVRLQPRAHVNPAAHVAYLRGRYLWNRWSPDAVRESIGCFEEAVRADPSYALAYAGLADAYITLGTTRALAPGEAFPRARAATERGLALDPLLGELHASLAVILRLQDWDWPGTEREYRRALELNPGYSTAHDRYAMHLAMLGRHEEARAEVMLALELDPAFAHRAYRRGRRRCSGPAGSRSPFRTTGARWRWIPRSAPATPTWPARSSTWAATTRRSSSSAAASFAPDGTVPPSTGLAIMTWRTGRHDEARRVMEDVMKLAATRYVAPFGIASFHAVAGEIPAALDWLERAYAERDGSMVFLKVHPRLDVLRGEPRFRALLAAMRLDA